MASEPNKKDARDGAKSTIDRAKERKQQRKKEEPEQHLSFLQRIRGLVDALVFAFVLAMFIRSFVFELFMIPTGSMTPTLIGDNEGSVTILDYDEDGVDDVVYRFTHFDYVQIYLMNEDGTYKDEIFVAEVPYETLRSLARQTKHRKDMIIVNKFKYWFSTPDRGDIAVFKTPHRPEKGLPFDPTKPVYIKRVVGLPGESISFLPVTSVEVDARNPARYGSKLGGIEIHLTTEPVIADGKPLSEGPFSYLMHFPRPVGGNLPEASDPANTIAVPDDSVLMVGDNSASSLDGRYWGAVPENHLRGKAILRHWPLKAFGVLR